MPSDDQDNSRRSFARPPMDTQSADTDFPFDVPDGFKKAKRSWKRWSHALLFTVLLCTVLLSLRLLVPNVYSRPLVENMDSHSELFVRDVGGPGHLVTAHEGAVAADSKQCSLVGVKILKDGGNAVDAAIATVFCLGVVGMFSSGIGGGGFMTIRMAPSDSQPEPDVYTINFRETVPAGAYKDMYGEDPHRAAIGGLAVAVPGEVLGLEAAYNISHRLNWTDLIKPSIEIANGWNVSKELAKRMQWKDYRDLLLHNKDWNTIFAPNGTLLTEGQLIQRKNLADTLGKIARGGAHEFYNGSIAKNLVKKITSENGILSEADLGNYAVEVDRAVQGKYRNRTVYTTHPPSSGYEMIYMLNILELYTMKRRTWDNIHRSIEIMKYGAAARTRLGDPYFHPNASHMDEILDKNFAKAVWKNITNITHTPDYYNPEYDIPTDHGTTHVSVVQRDGMAVSVTSSVNLIFGSQVLDPVTGIILNDQMADFSIPNSTSSFGLMPIPYNYPAPGKRPVSSMAPVIIDDGGNLTVVGASGGSHIPTAVLQTLMNLDWGLDPSQAVEYARLHDQLYPQHIEIEDFYPNLDDLKEQLTRRHHNFTVNDTTNPAAVVQVAVKTSELIYAASDSRKNGEAAGYDEDTT